MRRLCFVLIALSVTSRAVESSPVLIDWPSAGAVAMAGAMAGRPFGPSGSFWNPGAIGCCSRLEFSIAARELMPYQWYGHGSLLYGLPSGVDNSQLGLGAAATLVSHPPVDVPGSGGTTAGWFRPWDGHLCAQAGYDLHRRLGVGVTVGWFYRMVEPAWAFEEGGVGFAPGGEEAQALTLGFGVLFRATSALSVGASVTNLGTDVAYRSGASDVLPKTARLGGAYTPIDNRFVSLAVRPELELVLPERTQGLWNEIWKAVAVELSLLDMFIFRVGLMHAPAWNRTGITYGLAFNYKDYVLLEVGDDQYLIDRGSRQWSFSLTVLSLPDFVRGSAAP